ncbi:MAG: HipA domain-containing protein [Candidatus Caenarcaniphilales bacterium]|nr:HipA domain-containing protein [Candidatus Caenarcaniphilales bacterium]
MATHNWAKVYFYEEFAGYLEQKSGGDYLFTYDDDFRKKQISISIQLPISKKEHISKNGLHPFFDNLIAEGIQAKIQAKALGINESERFKLLLAFGFDLIGAVSIEDPKPDYKVKIDNADCFQKATLTPRASISGVQSKLLIVKDTHRYRPANFGEVSTHIAKLAGNLDSIIENEFLTMKITAILLDKDKVAEVGISEIENLGKALIVKRFDRTENKQKIHFEEFTQILGNGSEDKYDGSYKEMADFMNNNPRFFNKIDIEKLFRRILACILLGNTDAHKKNFAMFKNRDNFDFTPIYDMVFVKYYPDYSSEMALNIIPETNIKIQNLKAKHLKILSQDFALNEKVLVKIKKDFEKRLDLIYKFLETETHIYCDLRNKLKEHIEKRWQGLFKNIGQK